MEWLINNWYLIVALIACLVAAVTGVVKFAKLSREQQIENLQEWLKWAVTEAEKELGSGTGQLKLRRVYDLALAKFRGSRASYRSRSSACGSMGH